MDTISEQSRRLAEEYCIRCDEYDALHCTGRGPDGPIPANVEELVKINKHAMEVMRSIRLRATNMDEVRRAIVKINTQP